MKTTFLGAAQSVTGSCHVIEAAGHRFAVDCGMFQGSRALEQRNFSEEYHPEKLDFILLTHAHIDHCGLLPRFVEKGFHGPVWCTPPTADLAAIMLEDSAHIQTADHEWKSRHDQRHGENEKTPPADDGPLYSVEAAAEAAKLLRPVEFGSSFEPAAGVQVVFRHAGHILGAAILEITITEDGERTRLVFSGDLGRPGALLLPNAEKPENPDWLFMESTYGDRDHKGEDDTLDELAEAIGYSWRKREKVLIPAFAVERTQEILYSLYKLKKQGRLPEGMPVFVDSPMALKATRIFLKYSGDLNTPDISAEDYTKASEKGGMVEFTQTVADSQALNERKGPAIVLSASGMCNAGRIRHHLKHNIWRPGVSIVFVGYQAQGTPGRRLVDGAKTLRLFGEELAVRARIFTINGFSAHAGRSQLIEWAGDVASPDTHIVLVHGEPEAQHSLAAALKEKLGIDALIPDYLDSCVLDGSTHKETIVTPAPAGRARPEVNWDFLSSELEQRMQQLRERLRHARELPWEEQTELRDRLAEIEHDIFIFLSQI